MKCQQIHYFSSKQSVVKMWSNWGRHYCTECAVLSSPVEYLLLYPSGSTTALKVGHEHIGCLLLTILYSTGLRLAYNGIVVFIALQAGRTGSVGIFYYYSTPNLAGHPNAHDILSVKLYTRILHPRALPKRSARRYQKRNGTSGALPPA